MGWVDERAAFLGTVEENPVRVQRLVTESFIVSIRMANARKRHESQSLV